jgi:EpsI family protein
MSPSRAAATPAWNRAWLVGLLLVGATGAAHHLYRPSAVPLAGALEALPGVIGEWQGEPVDPRLEPFRLPAADHEVFRVYRSAAGEAVSLYVAYFERQEEGREVVGQPHLKLYGGEVVAVGTGPSRVDRVRRVRLDQDGHQRLVHAWYEVNGRVLAEPVVVKLATMADILWRGHSNGALVLVGEPPVWPGARTAVLERQLAFIREVAPLVRAALPQR